MNIEELRSFIAVVDTGSITAASQILNRVQSSISHRLKNLEAHLGIPLLDRHAGGVTMTAQGRIVYDYAIKVTNLLDECEKKVANKTGNENVRIGIIECLPPPVVDPIINLNHIANYNIAITTGNTTDILSSFENDEFDMIIIGAGFAPHKYTKTPLFEDEFILISSREFNPINEIAHLRDLVFLVSSKKCASIKNINTLFEETGVTPRRIVECGSYPILFSKVIDGTGVSLVLKSSIINGFARKIKMHNLRGGFSRFQVELVTRKNYENRWMPEVQDMITSALTKPQFANHA